MRERAVDSDQTRATWVEGPGEEELHEPSDDRHDHPDARCQKKLPQVAAVFEKHLFDGQIQEHDGCQAEHRSLGDSSIDRRDVTRDEEHEESNEGPAEWCEPVPVAGSFPTDQMKDGDENRQDAENCRWLEGAELVGDQVIESGAHCEGDQKEPRVAVEPDDCEDHR